MNPPPYNPPTSLFELGSATWARRTRLFYGLLVSGRYRLTGTNANLNAQDTVDAYRRWLRAKI